jgi:hypothetical protein
MFYSKSTKGFHSKEINGDNIPTDAVEISQDEYLALLDAQTQGKIIQWDSKKQSPIAAEPLPPTTAELNAIRKTEILAELDAIDAKSIRALRSSDVQRLTDLEAQAVTLRTELATL